MLKMKKMYLKNYHQIILINNMKIIKLTTKIIIMKKMNLIQCSNKFNNNINKKQQKSLNKRKKNKKWSN